jgi:hypothetical protein
MRHAPTAVRRCATAAGCGFRRRGVGRGRQRGRKNNDRHPDFEFRHDTLCPRHGFSARLDDRWAPDNSQDAAKFPILIGAVTFVAKKVT